MRKQPALIFALAAALVLGVYVTAGGQSGGSASPTRVAVVDLQEVINNSDQQAAYTQTNQAKAEELRSEQQRRQQEIVTMQNAIDPLQPGSDAWRNKRNEIQQKSMELEVWARMQEQNNQLEQARQFATIYQTANEAAAAVAESAGYDVVLTTGELPDLMRLNIEGLRTVVQSRKVVYAADRVDITAAVLQRVNAEAK
jgi:Skp family chaperone for outer membrane proteins